MKLAQLCASGRDRDGAIQAARKALEMLRVCLGKTSDEVSELESMLRDLGET